ncbi:MAG TPA: ATP-binding protein, partial [Gemmatimonadaceae bacterium]|jgi:CheY-like chemotaxis protein|nr:ATP-binding protein [Gemmatimonadaceae bacterium]
MNAAIGSVEKMLRRLIGEHIEFRTRLDAAIGQIKADPGQLEQVIVNLVVNARDAMPNGGVLTIETSNVLLDAARAKDLAVSMAPLAPGPHVMVAISDSGSGIAPDDMERIFEPFFTTKESGKGTGLGLSTVHGIVEQSGGQIRVMSKLAQGTRFELYFPVAGVEDQKTPVSTPHAAPRRGSERILLVEDDAAVRTVASAVLRRAGYTVIVAGDGAEALRTFDDPGLGLDLVITDMVMPSMGGRDLSTHLRRLHPGLPILFMSGYTRDTGVFNSGLAAGDSFIEKPFTPEMFTQRVREALERTAAQNEPPPQQPPSV